MDGADEEGDELGMYSPTRQQQQGQNFGGHMATDASVLSGECCIRNPPVITHQANHIL